VTPYADLLSVPDSNFLIIHGEHLRCIFFEGQGTRDLNFIFTTLM